MKKNARLAFNALKKIGCPVYEGTWDGDDDYFRISAEENYGDDLWADYYIMTDGGYDGGIEGMDDFGVNEKINAILKKYRLTCEWANAAVLDVYPA